MDKTDTANRTNGLKEPLEIFIRILLKGGRIPCDLYKHQSNPETCFYRTNVELKHQIGREQLWLIACGMLL